MALARLFRVSVVAAVAFAFSIPLTAQAGDALATIQAKLNSQFKLTKTTADRTDIVTAGDVVQIHKPGLVMYGVASPLPPSNSYKNGKIGQGMGGFGKDLMIGMVTPGSAGAANYPHRTFVPEEKCWVTGIQVQKDGVLFQLYSDPYDDVRYYANLKIPFPDKKTVPPADTEIQNVSEVLTVIPTEDQGAAQQAPFSGQYANSNPRSTEHFLFLADGSFTKFVGDGQGHGKFSVDGDKLALTFAPSGATQTFTIQSDRIVDSTDPRRQFVRSGDAPAPPAEQSQHSTPSGPQPIAGQYLAPGGSHLLLLPDGSFTKFVGAGQGQGKYAVDGDTLTFTFTATGFAQKFKIQSGNLVDVNTLQVWARTGDAPTTPLPDIAPPPPPADAPPPTIAIGQTKDQVTAGFGQPTRVAKLGVKEIFYYKDMKVTFTNGKVTNVE